MKIITTAAILVTLAGPASAQFVPAWQNIPSGVTPSQPYLPNVMTPTVPPPQILTPNGMGGLQNYNGSIQIQPNPTGGYWSGNR